MSTFTTRRTPSAKPIGTLQAARRVATLTGGECTPHQLWQLVSEGRLRPGKAANGQLQWTERDILNAVNELEFINSR